MVGNDFEQVIRQFGQPVVFMTEDVDPYCCAQQESLCATKICEVQ